MAFKEIVGHRRILRLLSRSIAAESLPPSMVFAGPEGVGKRLAAQAVAQALNCPTPDVVAGTSWDACGTCPACRRIARGLHPDVQMIVPGENGSIKIEQIRGAIENTIYRPFEGKRRVTIIDDADLLLGGAQNALLKTLEEPPPASVFILVTSRVDALLPTVRSRCAVIRFAKLNVADVAAVLERRHKYTSRDALAAAASADGSARRALDARTEENSDARIVVGRLLTGTPGRSDARARVDRAADLMKGGTSASEREHLGIQLQALASMIRDIGVLVSGAPDALLANGDLRDELADVAASYDSDRAVRSFDAVQRANGALERNVSPKVVADWLALLL